MSSVMDDLEFFEICEALLFVSPDPLTPDDINRTLGKDLPDDFKLKLTKFTQHFNSRQGGLQVIEVAGGLQVVTKPEYSPYIRRMNTIRSETRLTRASLETLAIIAYRQPITIPEIEQIRSVDCSGVVRNLLDKTLITILGKRKVPGNPLLYGTTSKFLVDFGLPDLQSLPEIESFSKLAGTDETPGLPFETTDRENREDNASENQQRDSVGSCNGDI